MSVNYIKQFKLVKELLKDAKQQLATRFYDEDNKDITVESLDNERRALAFATQALVSITNNLESYYLRLNKWDTLVSSKIEEEK